MRPPPRGFIPKKEAEYIQLLLGHPLPKGKEAALERLCSHYRRGFRLHDPHGVCQTLSGLLYHGEPSVRRWTFNAIALVGNKGQNLEATRHALELNRADEDTCAAGMAALVALTTEAETEARLKQMGVEVDGVVLLAAAQQAPAYKGRLAERRVSPDLATAPELRLAAVLIGLDKAPEHLFTLGHQNADVIGALSGHDDRLVAQYAVWAVSERTDLNISHLGFPPAQLLDRPEDVRKYGYRLATADDTTAERYRELIEEAAHDKSVKAREGLAVGLANAYFEGLEAITLDWLTRETDAPIRDALVDHFVAQSQRSPLYAESAEDAYRTAAEGSMLRAKLQATAEGKPIYGTFRRIELQSSTRDLPGVGADLFGGVNVTNYNIKAQNVGVAGPGARVDGGIHQRAGNYTEQAQMELQTLLELLDKVQGLPRADEARRLAAEAKATPTRGLVEKVLAWIGVAKAGGDLIASGADSIATIGDRLGDLLPLLPPA